MGSHSLYGLLWRLAGDAHVGIVRGSGWWSCTNTRKLLWYYGRYGRGSVMEGVLCVLSVVIMYGVWSPNILFYTRMSVLCAVCMLYGAWLYCVDMTLIAPYCILCLGHPVLCFIRAWVCFVHSTWGIYACCMWGVISVLLICSVRGTNLFGRVVQHIICLGDPKWRAVPTQH